ncbi:MAG TPA: hypothetical protein VN909_03360 [Candidatus Dormibacteraeota bacterium]|nr:hypothetical protein [Candidatus Dormibacteraeota bacterium]
MVRGLIVGALAFAAAFAAERVIAGMRDDLTRYDAMRKMSGEKPIASELLSTVGSLITGSVQKSGVTSFVTSLTNDAVRYAKMRGM